jgi:hypothetical protein
LVGQLPKSEESPSSRPNFDPSVQTERPLRARVLIIPAYRCRYPNDLLSRTSTGILENTDRHRSGLGNWSLPDLQDRKSNLGALPYLKKRSCPRAHTIQLAAPICEDVDLLKFEEDVAKYVREESSVTYYSRMS